MEIDSEFSSSVFLGEFLRKEDQRLGTTGTLSNVILTIARATKIVSQGVNQAGLYSMVGITGEVNVQGEQVQKLDVYADRVFCNILGRSGEFISMVSEERETVFVPREAHANSKYVVAFDPVDGSSNIDVNVSIGSIWGIYRRKSEGGVISANDLSDFFQSGRNQVAAGYTIYGSSTMFVFSTGHGVHGFTLDPTIGEFIFTHKDMKIPSEGAIFSCNEGNFEDWSEGVKKYISWAKTPGSVGEKKAHSARYVGSLVADFHRTLLKGGMYLYPTDKKNPNGKLRLLYECAPLAFIAENADGRAFSGKSEILDLVPQSIHERTPIFIGSKNMVSKLEEFIKNNDK